MVFLLALLLATQPSSEPSSDTQADAETTVIAACAAHKFETIVHTTVAGKPHASKVKLCGKVGQTDADWLATLRDAVSKVAVNPSMSAEAKDQIITALNLEITKVEGATKSNSPGAIILALPPVPKAAPPVSGEASAPTAGPSLSGPVEYSVLPPLPAPTPGSSAAPPALSLPTLPAPKMTFRCLAMNTLNTEGPCDLLERETLLTVRADENIPGGTSLRFLRRGDDRGEIDVSAMRAGQSRRFSLPPRLCAGVSGSRVEIQIVRTSSGRPQVVDTRGPFELRC